MLDPRAPWLLACCVLVCALLMAPAASGQQRRRLPDALRERAQAEGAVRVIVRLDQATLPEGRLASKASRSRQRRRIATAQDALGRELRGRRHRVTRRFRSVAFMAMEVDSEALQVLEDSPNVLSVQEDRLHTPTLDRSAQRVGADQALSLGFDGSGQSVVVLDTGVDGDHPNLAGKVVAEACFAAGSPYGSGDCPGGGLSDLGPGAGDACSYSDSCFHGTHVAGIAAGAGASYPGVAPGADVIAVQVFSRFEGASCGSESGPCPLSWSSDQIAALEYVFDTLRFQHDIASVNMSLGGGPFIDPVSCDLANLATKSAIDNLRSVGIATVIASGNEGYVNAISEPGCISSAVSVGAVDGAGRVASFSNAASFLSLWAPGVRITAPYFGGTGFTTASGTSMATPHVAGAWAVLRQHTPDLSVDDALATLQSSGFPVVDPQATTTSLRLDAALEALPQDLPACSDGSDNDGDGLVDLEDPGCLDAASPIENPPCDDGLDNDGDGRRDWGGLDLNGDGDFDDPGEAAPDGECVSRADENQPACGLGFEVALLLPALLLWRRRRGGRLTLG